MKDPEYKEKNPAEAGSFGSTKCNSDNDGNDQ